MGVTERLDWDLDQDLVSKYEILDVLGHGGMGRVLRARHRQLRRLVAIKLLQHDLRASEAVTRFLREARAAAHIRSAHVAHVLDAGILDSGQPYIVMEYLEGQDLSRWIAARGRLSIEQAVDFTLQALDALAEAHALRIVHRDIKPGNLFATRIVGRDTSIKILDFGLAKTTHAFDTLDPGVTERGAVLGTPTYMAPEQFIDAQDVDARADIWGVGATLFELLTGIPPFTGSNLPQVYTAVMHQPIPSIRGVLPDLPEALESVVAKCLTRDRAQRYANVGELALALAAFAPARARDQIARIERIVQGELDPADLADPDADETVAQPVSRPVPVSSGFARRDPPAEASLPQPRAARSSRFWLIVALLCLTGLGYGVTRLGSAPPPPPPAAAASVPAPHISAPAKVEVPAPPRVEQPTPAPPPAENVSRPTAAKRRRPRVSASGSSRSASSEIYEQYP